MIVCHCMGVREQSVREAVRAGARSCREVARACQAGRCCGGCRPALRRIIRDEQAAPGPASAEEIAVAAS